MDEIANINLNRAIRLVELSRHKEAIPYLQASLDESNEDDSLAYFYLFLCFSCLDDQESAKSVVDEALSKFPGDAHHYINLSIYFSKRKEFSQSLKVIKIALEMAPESARVLARTAIVLLEMGEIYEAENYILAAEKIDPNEEILRYAKIIFHQRNNDLVAALGSAEEALALDPNNPILNIQYTKLLLQNRGTIKLAEEAAYHSLSLAPDALEPKLNVLKVLKSKNMILRYLIDKPFGRYHFQGMSVVEILANFVFWWLIITGFIHSIYVFINWYGNVLFNTCIRLHKTHKYLLTPGRIVQSNFFLVMHALLFLIFSLKYFLYMEEDLFLPIIWLAFLMLFLGLSYFRIRTKRGKIEFFLYGLLALGVLLFWGIGEAPLMFFIGIMTVYIYVYLFNYSLAFK